MLPNSGTTITYTGYWLESTVTYTVNYMLQNADDNGYTRSEDYSQTYNYSPGASLSPKDIPGYTYVRRTDSGNTSNLYYDRAKFKIDYYFGSTKLDTIEGIKFDANINKAPYVWTPTTAQCGLADDFEFEGWYTSASFAEGTKYTFNKMPASDLKLYAKWNTPTYTVTFYKDADAEEAGTPLTTIVGNPFTVEYGNFVSDVGTNIPENLEPEENREFNK